MRLELGLNLKLSQQLRLAPQIIQSIEILQLPAMDLKELIENELQENEALEITEPAADGLEARVETPSEPDAEEMAFETDAERVFDRLEDLAGAERLNGSYQTRSAGEEAADRKLEAMQNAPALEQGLADHLLHQLDELDVEDDERLAARDIIYNLSDTGLLNCSLQDVIDGMDEPVSMEVAERALRIVQTLDPRGVGARDLRECLLLQVTDDDPDAALQRTLIRDHLDDVKRNKLPRIAKAMGLEVAARLRPHPRPRAT